MHGDSLIFDQMMRMGPGVSRAERDFYTIDRTVGTLKAIKFIANHLARLRPEPDLGLRRLPHGNPVSARRPCAIHRRSSATSASADQRTVRAVNEANMAIYPVDMDSWSAAASLTRLREALPRGGRERRKWLASGIRTP